MKKSLIALVCISLVTWILSGCAAKEGADKASRSGKESHKVTVATDDFHEFCELWDVGDTVNVSFASSKPVLFDVHYHIQHEKFYPIEEILVDEFTGSFVVQSKDVHCGMWQNKNDNYVTLTYEIEVK